MIISKKRITNALISLRGCAGWSAPLLFANPEDRFVASRPIYTCIMSMYCFTYYMFFHQYLHRFEDNMKKISA